LLAYSVYYTIFVAVKRKPLLRIGAGVHEEQKKTLREKEVQNPEGITKKEVDEKKFPCSSIVKPSWLVMVT